MPALDRILKNTSSGLSGLLGRLDPVGKFFLLFQLNGGRPIDAWTTPTVASDAELARLLAATDARISFLRQFDPEVYRRQIAARADDGSAVAGNDTDIALQIDWLEHGCREGLVFAAQPAFAEAVLPHFDDAWYAGQLHERQISQPGCGLLSHYLQAGCLVGLSPNSRFDERFYLMRNRDVLDAVLNGAFRCGFEHYLAEGEQEGRSFAPAETDETTNALPIGDAGFVQWGPEARRALVGRLSPLGKHYLLLQLNDRRPATAWNGPMVPSDDELADLFGAADVPLTLLPRFDPEVYRQQLMASGDGGSHVARAGSSLDMQVDWLERGRAEGLVFAALPERGVQTRKGRAPVFADAVVGYFDETWYAGQLRAMRIATPRVGLLNHYLQAGCLVGLSPNNWFHETLYLMRNPDVLDAVLCARFRCGFEHYLAAGEAEGRNAMLSEQDYLDEIFPGLGRPVLLETLGDYENLVRPRLRIRKAPSTGRPRVNYLIPRLGNDVMFGGLISFMEFVCALDRRFNVAHRFIVTEDIANALEVVARVTAANPCHAIIAAGEVIKSVDGITVAPDDVFVAYNAKAAYMAHRLAASARNPRFLYFVQEWETVFHSFGAVSGAIDRSYALDCHLLFNSAPLREWFGRLGLCADNASTVFSHVLTRSDAPSVSRGNTVLAYLRPEGHAARNCFEVVVMALRHLLQICPDARGFRFLGIGALRPGSVWLDPETELQLLPKMPLSDYAAMLASSTVGVSLMNAPHPSVVPYEMAQFGMYTVTNVYANRSADDIRALSPYLLPCELDYRSVAQALADAVRSALERPGVYRALNHPASWDEAFAPALGDIGAVFDLPR